MAQQDFILLLLGYWLAIPLIGMLLPISATVLVVFAVAGPLAAVVHLWGARVERTGPSIVVRNGLFSRRQVLSTTDLEAGCDRYDFVGVLKVTGVGADLPRAVVLIHRKTGQRTKVLASAVATRKQRKQVWEQLTRRLPKQTGAYSLFQLQ